MLHASRAGKGQQTGKTGQKLNHNRINVCFLVQLHNQNGRATEKFQAQKKSLFSGVCNYVGILGESLLLRGMILSRII